MVRSVLAQLARVIPSWKIIPTQDITDAAIRDVEVRKDVRLTPTFFFLLQNTLNISGSENRNFIHLCKWQIRSDPYCYKGRPRLQTGFQLMQTTRDIEKIIPEVNNRL